MTIYEGEPRFNIWGFSIGHKEKIAKPGEIIHKVEDPDIQECPEGSWHGHYFGVIDPDTITVGRLENISIAKASTETELEINIRYVPGYRLSKDKINENPICKGSVRWAP